MTINFFGLDVVEPFIGEDGTDYEGLSARIIRNDNERYPYRVEFYDGEHAIIEFTRFSSHVMNAYAMCREFTTGYPTKYL